METSRPMPDSQVGMVNAQKALEEAAKTLKKAN